MTEAIGNEPQYKLEEGDKYITITITAPLSRPNSAAVVLEKNVLTFETHPYLLNLKLPSKVSDIYNDVSFNVATSTYLIKLKKDSSLSKGEEEEEGKEEVDCLESELIADVLKKEEISEINSEEQFYGFGNFYSKMFGQHYDEFSDVFDIPNPDKTDPKERSDLRCKDETEKWDVDHYLADMMDPESGNISSYLDYEPMWIKAPVKDLSDDDREALEEIPKKDWMQNGVIDKVKKTCELQMIDILFSYAYNKRITEGDNAVTSAWNITKLSSTLSWFEVFASIKEVVVSCYRRFIIYPLCRSLVLAETVRKDVAEILKLGPTQVTKCLLEIRDLFNETDNYYVLNTLYINDLAYFAYKLDCERAKALSKEIVDVKIKKIEVHEDLPLLEISAYLVFNEENGDASDPDMSLLMKKLCNLRLKASESKNEADKADSSDNSSEGSDSSNDIDSTDGDSGSWESEDDEDEEEGDSEDSEDSDEDETSDDNFSDEADDEEDDELEEAMEKEDYMKSDLEYTDEEQKKPGDKDKKAE